jgi:hypothetical protein
MDKELIEEIVRLKIESKILRGLVDVILDNCYLGYSGDMRLTNEDRVLAVVKTFYGEECDNKFKALKDDKRAEIERLKSNGAEVE